MNSKQLNIKFYQNVAKVFYAMAYVDNEIRETEIRALKNIVKEEWVLLDETEDDFHTDGAYQIEVVFDWLQSKDANAKISYKEFTEYYEDHPYFFTNSIKELILKTAEKIASAFAGKNKSELIFLGNLSILFRKEMGLV
ncbi:hypothetical protein WH52_01155 [Tenacibaculum holothuriorum]|uniref:Co-chaperone DjlA N-terminal domain-containing protein n=1 Tax=Tenacibaculum holothuriorum TaxID=1635173 RepID=A0A1Y2PFL8_9FLAO|nr:hypothetical protein [Tenacibaculum holothuriorum]OSY89283.1 hypothetical protein WH52_01155 [Tenacibaculum holothuriorum]